MISRPKLRTVSDAPPESSGAGGQEGLAVRIRRALQASAYPAVRRIHVEYTDGVLILRGALPSYYYVQIAISLVRAKLQRNVPIRNCLTAGPKTGRRVAFSAAARA